jgi:HPt (histidine-containing phosphotransfer) domain-containing protein
MFVLPTVTIDRLDAPPLAPVEQPVDLVHLSRMTLGDRDLEREVLQLFECQAAMLLQRMPGAGPAHVAAMAHTIKGSARGIGAWQIARDAETLELAAASPGDADRDVALTGLTGSVEKVRAVIRDLLRSH